MDRGRVRLFRGEQDTQLTGEVALWLAVHQLSTSLEEGYYGPMGCVGYVSSVS